MVHCLKCGKDNPDKQRLCFWCGTDLKGVQEPETVQPALAQPARLSTARAPDQQVPPPRKTTEKWSRWRSHSKVGAVGFVAGIVVTMIIVVCVVPGFIENLLGGYSDNQPVATTISPPYIQIENRTVNMVFNASDGTLHWWTIGVDTLEAQINAGYIRRELMPNYIQPTLLGFYENLYVPLAALAGETTEEILAGYTSFYENLSGLGLQYINLTENDTGENHLVVDYRTFVVENNFTTVMSNLYNELDSDQAFVHEVWYIVTQLTSYSSEIGDIPRYPFETLIGGGGDCEDMAILIASMLKAAPENYTVELLYIDSNNPTSPENVNHVLVWVETPSGYKTFVDGTSKSVMCPFTLVDGWYLAV